MIKKIRFGSECSVERVYKAQTYKVQSWTSYLIIYLKKLILFWALNDWGTSFDTQLDFETRTYLRDDV